MLNQNRPCTGPDDPGPCIVQDGQTRRVNLAMMDACQCSVSKSAPARSVQLSDSQLHQIAVAQQNHGNVQRWADYYTGLREGEHDAARATPADRAYAGYADRISNAWKGA